MNKPNGKTWRYHATKKPCLVDIGDEDKLSAMEQEGWRDTPAAFKASPSEDQDDEPSEPELTEVQKALLESFKDDPESLTKPEMADLGKGLGIKLITSWKEETLISKIQERLTNE